MMCTSSGEWFVIDIDTVSTAVSFYTDIRWENGRNTTEYSKCTEIRDIIAMRPLAILHRLDCNYWYTFEREKMLYFVAIW